MGFAVVNVAWQRVNRRVRWKLPNTPDSHHGLSQIAIVTPDSVLLYCWFRNFVKVTALPIEGVLRVGVVGCPGRTRSCVPSVSGRRVNDGFSSCSSTGKFGVATAGRAFFFPPEGVHALGCVTLSEDHVVLAPLVVELIRDTVAVSPTATSHWRRIGLVSRRCNSSSLPEQNRSHSREGSL